MVNVAISYALNSIAGNEYTLKDAAIDALVGAASGALAASGLGVVAQAVGGALISGGSTLYNVSRDGELSTQDYLQVAVSAAFGAFGGRYSGAGIMANSNVSPQMQIINANMHCAARTSASNSIKSSLKHISYELLDAGKKFFTTSAIGNSITAIQSAK